MEQRYPLIASAMAAGVMSFPAGSAPDGNNLEQVGQRIARFAEKAKGSPTLFVGAAISTFKPAQLPMWNDFVRLLWSSAMKAAAGQDMQPEQLSSFLDQFKSSVPNYLVTEVISRRLGQEYLQVLDAFRAETAEDGGYCINDVHRWVARCLVSGNVAAVMTTNFDDYLEKAIQTLHDNFYQISGDPHTDGREISSRLLRRTQDTRLVLLVSGAKAFSFVRSLIPQLGQGKITFLFKLHGSCYDPPSCIDTRLQRSQGLPSFATSILDSLLRRTVWLVVGYSGSDMTDNLDYLRFLSNKKQTSIVWMAHPGGWKDPTPTRLVKALEGNRDDPFGLCIVNGSLRGERHEGSIKFPRFEAKIDAWAQSLGRDWSRLVLLDTIALFEERSGVKAPRGLLQSLSGEESPRQDWNGILGAMSLQTREAQQAVMARTCSEVWQILHRLLTDSTMASDIPVAVEAFKELNDLVKLLGRHYVDLEAAAFDAEQPRIHAQAWVLPALTGLALLTGGKLVEANRALEMASSIAWVAGNFDDYQAVNEVVVIMAGKRVVPEMPLPVAAEYRGVRRVVFSPALDNENAKMNRFGVPPERYIRALLHRSLLFADGLALSDNMIINSQVFLDEILFQGELGKLNETYAKHIFPILPDTLRDSTRKLTRCRATKPAGYTFEQINEDHLAQLDDFYERPENAHQMIYFKVEKAGLEYGKFVRQEADQSSRDVTIQHLTDLWNHAEAGGGWNVDKKDTDRSSAAKDAAEDLVDTFSLYLSMLPKAIRRSDLYTFADLHQGAVDKNEHLKCARSDVSDEDKAALALCRDRLIQKPWLYGPFCHELFDAPYRSVVVFDYASQAQNDSLLFLEDDEVPSWEYIAKVCRFPDSPTYFRPEAGSYGGRKYSALLLSQTSEANLLKTRQDLSEFREKLYSGETLSDHDIRKMQNHMSRLESRSLKLPEAEITGLANLDAGIKQKAIELLRHCIFLVRKGLPLDPMYEEAQITLPGLLVLRREEVAA